MAARKSAFETTCLTAPDAGAVLIEPPRSDGAPLYRVSFGDSLKPTNLIVAVPHDNEGFDVYFRGFCDLLSLSYRSRVCSANEAKKLQALWPTNVLGHHTNENAYVHSEFISSLRYFASDDMNQIARAMGLNVSQRQHVHRAATFIFESTAKAVEIMRKHEKAHKDAAAQFYRGNAPPAGPGKTTTLVEPETKPIEAHALVNAVVTAVVFDADGVSLRVRRTDGEEGELQLR
jgi:hypothetical protein